MVRPLRIEYEDAYYHVMNRGGGRRSIFHGQQYYLGFLDCLDQAHTRFGVEIQAYCLMGNHYHLLIKTPRGNLSRAMRHINGVYTQYYNKIKKTDGPLFRGRYKAINIDAASYLTQVSRYIHRNPIDMKKPIVESIIDYPWSSYPAYLNKARCPDWLYRNDVYGELGSKRHASSYRAFVERGVDDETRNYYAKGHWPAVRGDKDFRARADAHALNQGREINRRRETIPIKRIIQSIADYFQVSKQSITKTKRGRQERNLPRWIAMKLCQDYSGETLTSISEHFNVGTYGTVSITIARLNELMNTDKAVREQFDIISIDLTP